jgi:hypothetical protein
LADIKKIKTATAVIMISITEDVLLEEKCRLLGADFFCDLFHHYQDIPQIMDCITAGILQRHPQNNYNNEKPDR